MKKILALPVSILVFICMSIFFVSPQNTAYAELSNGIYSINYQVLKADSDSVSIANDYFNKPATLIVENGEKYIQFTINHSKWVKELKGPNGNVSVVNENKDKDTRAVKFKVGDISKPVTMDMHIVFQMDGQDYDQTHKARFAFDEGSAKPLGTKAPSDDKTKNEAAGSGVKQDDNPPTGDNAPITLLAFLFAASALVIFISRRSVKN